MSYKFTRCKRECGAMVAVTTYQKSEWKKNRGIITKYRGICDSCLTDDERKEVADEIIAAHKQSSSEAVRQNALDGKSEKTLPLAIFKRQPRKRIKYGRQVVIKGETS